jgi:A/G-specific adenine glycosylase
MTSPDHSDFSKRVLDWFALHGRKHLPWQQNINPYRVWVSEIMLQQTQVNTVIPYFQHFMEQLPSTESLAQASEDQVLHLWTGLGYYSRARNLHKAAKQICQQLDGSFPQTVEQLCELPGIGRSTAGAIASIAFSQAAAILDGNVKRVLARYHAVAGWPGQSATAKQLWGYAEQHTPTKNTAEYSQAMMDLGATLCTRSKPRCEQCPLLDNCQAYQLGDPSRYPGKKPKKTLPVKATQMLIIENPDGKILLEKRPPSGIWGGLWGFPEISLDIDPAQHCLQLLGSKVNSTDKWAVFRHTFSHYHLDISPIKLSLSRQPTQVMEEKRQLWYNVQQPQQLGLSTPVKRLLSKL